MFHRHWFIVLLDTIWWEHLWRYLFSFSLTNLILPFSDLKDNEWIDFSNYPKPDPQLQSTELYDISQNYSEEKKLVPGFFKDDMGGKVINSFIGLR